MRCEFRLEVSASLEIAVATLIHSAISSIKRLVQQSSDTQLCSDDTFLGLVCRCLLIGAVKQLHYQNTVIE
jgi:hypothetical protein